MSNPRHLHISTDDKGDSLLTQVFTAPTNPLIVIPGTGEPEYYNSIKDKLEALESYRATGDQSTLTLFVWEGKKKTDVFTLNVDDIDRIILLFDNQ